MALPNMKTEYLESSRKQTEYDIRCVREDIYALGISADTASEMDRLCEKLDYLVTIRQLTECCLAERGQQ